MSRSTNNHPYYSKETSKETNNMWIININRSKALHTYTKEEQHAIRHYIQPKSNKLYNRIKNVKFEFEGGGTWSKRKSCGTSFLTKLMQIYTKESIQVFVSTPNVYEIHLYLVNMLKSSPICLVENVERDENGNVVKDNSMYYEVVKCGGNQKVFCIDMNRPWPDVCVFKQLKVTNPFHEHTYILLQRVGTTWEDAKNCYMDHLDNDVLLPVKDVLCGRLHGVSVKRVSNQRNGKEHWDMKGCEIDQHIPNNIGDTCFLLVSLHDIKRVYKTIVQSHDFSSSSFESYASTVKKEKMTDLLRKTPVVTSQMINLVMSTMYKKISPT